VAKSDLLSHALQGMCQDNDCELHRIEVAIEEEVVRESDVAFWLAGWSAAMDYMRIAVDEVRDETWREGCKRATPDHSRRA
jgi:hypothetical protein